MSTAIKRLIEQWKDAVVSRDIDKIVSFYADDIVSFDAVTALQFKGKAAYRARIGLVTPEFHAYPKLTARENLDFFLGFRRAAPLSPVQYEQLLARVGLASDQVAGKFVEHFSTGMRKRLHLAILLASEADIWLLDEPGANLDAVGRSMVRREARLAADGGKLVLLAARDPQHSIAEYVTECWLQICRYPLARRPQRIAANLALDTRRSVWAGEQPTVSLDPQVLNDLAHSAGPDAITVIRNATRLGLIDRSAAACLVAVYCLGLRSHEAAQRLSISADLVRWRNARSIRRLAPHAAVLAAA